MENNISSKIVYACDILLDSVGMRDGYTKAHCQRCSWLSQKIYAKYLRDLFANDKESYDVFVKNFMEIAGNFEILNESDEMLLDYRSIFLGWACFVHDMAKIAWSDLMLKGPRHKNEECGECGSTCTKVRDNHPEEAAKRLLSSFKTGPNSTTDQRLTWIALVLFHHRNYLEQETVPRGYPAIIENISDDDVREFAVQCNKTTDMIGILEHGEYETNPMRLMLGIMRLVDSLDAMTSKRSYKNIAHIRSFENNEGEKFLTRWHPDNFITTTDYNHIYQEAYDNGRALLFRKCMKSEWERYKNLSVQPIVLQTYQDWLEGEYHKACEASPGLTTTEWRQSKIETYIESYINTARYDAYKWYHDFDTYRRDAEVRDHIDDGIKMYIKNFTSVDYDNEAESRFREWTNSNVNDEISRDEWFRKFDRWTWSILQIEETRGRWVNKIWEPCVSELKVCTDKGVYHPVVLDVLDQYSSDFGGAFFSTKYTMYPDSLGDLYPCKTMTNLFDSVKLKSARAD